MSKLDDARMKINQIDEAMLKLFEERMQAVLMVAEYKLENHLPILDASREQSIIDKNVSMLNDKELESYYRVFFEGVLTSSKKYQKDFIK
ncbi:MAG: chorismate mutase [Roseburia sp.]|nr:chorismate mutase [Anaeroplasma bactoclasticum]MCM1196162.1 chorismate mutase [Roseburia sp.]MCM1556997.1 chorismate mutase [Anaeroplasma bactoclasticum]